MSESEYEADFEHDCVYVVQADNGEVKIGVSGTPFARLSKIKKEYGARRNFRDAYVAAFVTTKFGFLVETAAQRSLERYAVGGEWYRVNLLLALRAICEAAWLVGDNVILQTFGPSKELRVSRHVFRSFVRQCVPNYRA